MVNTGCPIQDLFGRNFGDNGDWYTLWSMDSTLGGESCRYLCQCSIQVVSRRWLCHRTVSWIFYPISQRYWHRRLSRWTTQRPTLAEQLVTICCRFTRNIEIVEKRGVSRLWHSWCLGTSGWVTGMAVTNHAGRSRRWSMVQPTKSENSREKRRSNRRIQQYSLHPNWGSIDVQGEEPPPKGWSGLSCLFAKYKPRSAALAGRKIAASTFTRSWLDKISAVKIRRLPCAF